jgi:hypothetical protein
LFSFFQKKKHSEIDSNLLGRWNFIRSEGDIEIGKSMVATFFSDGRLKYEIDTGEKTQIMNLIFHTNENILITDQP